MEKNDIDLIELLKIYWSNRKFIFSTVLIFIIIGAIVAFTSPVEYTASCKLLPEVQENTKLNLGGLGGLAGLAGINLNNATNAGVMSPQLYPEIVKSLPFLMELINDTIYFESIDTNTTSLNYFQEIQKPSFLGYISKYTIGLPSLIKGAIFNSNDGITTESTDLKFIRLSKKEWGIVRNFKDRISVELDRISGVIYVSIEMPDPVAAAQLSKKTEELITEYVTRYKTDKASADLEYLEKMFDEKREKFEKLQIRLALVTDRNKDLSTSSARIRIRNIENEYNVAFELYKNLASQVERAKIKLTEETPVFTILEPVRIPESKSKPRKGRILVAAMFLGFFSSLLIVLVRILIFKK